MRALLITLAIAVFVGAAALVGFSVQWRNNMSQPGLGPSEAQQNRAEERAVQKSAPPQQLSQAQIRRYQEQLDKRGVSDGLREGRLHPTNRGCTARLSAQIRLTHYRRIG